MGSEDILLEQFLDANLYPGLENKLFEPQVFPCVGYSLWNLRHLVCTDRFQLLEELS